MHTEKQGLGGITPEELLHIQRVIKRFPKLSRTALAETLSEHLQWFGPSGAIKTQKCRQLLDYLADQGLVTLPPARFAASKAPDTPPLITERTQEQSLLACSLRDLAPIELVLTNEKPDITLWNEYVERYHPLGHKRPFGHWLRYFICAHGKRLGCIFLSGAARALHRRDHWIGWSSSQRKRNLHWVINNSRYLLFPWVQVPHLASHVLGQLVKRAAIDWEQRWGYRPVLMETFVDPRYNGTCYRAAGWALLGMTRGEGIKRPGKQYTTTPKYIFAKPLTPHFQSLLTSTTLQGRINE